MITYKALDTKDIKLLQETVKVFRDQNINEEKALDFLNNPTNIVHVALDDDKVVGYVLAYRLNRMDNGKDILIIFHLFVKEDHQRTGIGRTLMQRIIDYANSEPLHYALLITQTNNYKARKLYESLGGYNHPDDKEVYFWYITGRPVTDR
ncbi:MAG: GNAT family N-acetyltransferase [Firmicutes bacterium]|nr:GNAT family N-acetyltransferase [Candidatus Colivicinus equi]